MPDRPVTPRGRIFASVLDLVGSTPLVRLPRLQQADALDADLALKLEFFNPLGSVKDRIGLAMVEAAEQAGEIGPGRTTIVEPTSGNTGIALAFVAAAKGYKLIVVMPEGASVERRKLLRLLGAQVETTPAKQGMPGAIARADAILARTKDAWIARQFDNPANPAAHAASTAEEIWADTAGAVDIVVGGIGTGGTLTGIGRALKPRKASLRIVGVEPEESAVLSGDSPGPHRIQGIGAGFTPAVLERDLLDEIRPVSEPDSFAAARRCAATEGLPIGISSGAVLHAMLELGRLPQNKGKLIVGIAASFAERYLSTPLFAGL
ncbi:MAG: cysteine synthase A [Acetobacteraceae bacterium]